MPTELSNPFPDLPPLIPAEDSLDQQAANAQRSPIPVAAQEADGAAAAAGITQQRTGPASMHTPSSSVGTVGHDIQPDRAAWAEATAQTVCVQLGQHDVVKSVRKLEKSLEEKCEKFMESLKKAIGNRDIQTEIPINTPFPIKLDQNTIYLKVSQDGMMTIKDNDGTESSIHFNNNNGVALIGSAPDSFVSVRGNPEEEKKVNEGFTHTLEVTMKEMEIDPDQIHRIPIQNCDSPEGGTTISRTQLMVRAEKLYDGEMKYFLTNIGKNPVLTPKLQTDARWAEGVKSSKSVDSIQFIPPNIKGLIATVPGFPEAIGIHINGSKIIIQNKEFDLKTQPEVTVGRADTNDVMIPSKQVSGNHLKFEWDKRTQSVKYTDTSTNGTIMYSEYDLTKNARLLLDGVKVGGRLAGEFNRFRDADEKINFIANLIVQNYSPQQIENLNIAPLINAAEPDKTLQQKILKEILNKVGQSVLNQVVEKAKSLGQVETGTINDGQVTIKLEGVELKIEMKSFLKQNEGIAKIGHGIRISSFGKLKWGGDFNSLIKFFNNESNLVKLLQKE